MTVSLGDYLAALVKYPALIITSILTLGVIFVNGWTDSPNSIATCISTRSLKPRTAILMAAFFDFLGVFVMSFVQAGVAETILGMVNFGGDTKEATVALCAALLAIVTWAVLAWWFGIPTSESHALIAGISGAAIALQGGFKGINGAIWVRNIWGLILGVIMGFGLGYLFTKLTEELFRNSSRRKTEGAFQKAQIAGAAGMAFMHGVQDGQKFMSVFMLGIFLSQGKSDISGLRIPIWITILCSVVIAIGTSVGGYRIIKSVGMNMVRLKKYQGFSADVAGAVSLLTATIFKLPVSTTHTKTTAIMGVGAAKRLSSINWGIVKDMVLAWVLTFPGCGLIGYLMAKLFMKIF